MGQIESIAKSKKQKERKTWSKETRSNNTTERVSVEELDGGGYLVIVNKYVHKQNGEYFDETKKFYSEGNPLEPQESIIDKVFDALTRKDQS